MGESFAQFFPSFVEIPQQLDARNPPSSGVKNIKSTPPQTPPQYIITIHVAVNSYLSCIILHYQSKISTMAHQQGNFHTGPVSLEYSKSHAEARLGHEIFNDYGFVVRVRITTGEDFHLWMFMY
jgi:hypothetical protein